MNILLIGCNGRMGQAITLAASARTNTSIVAGIDLKPASSVYPVYTALDDVKEAFDVIIDFSHPSGTEKALQFAVCMKKPIVMATTGLDSEQLKLLQEASKTTAVLRSANMSLGVNLMIELVQKAAKALYENYDIELIEKHHNQKLDSPSGTALAIADAMNDAIADAMGIDTPPMTYLHGRHGAQTKRTDKEIGIHAVRGGTIAGEHTVLFAGKDELLEVKHTALSRSIFAEGALSAAVFLAGKKPGFYEMRDMFSGE